MNLPIKNYKTPVATPEEITQALSELGEDATADRIEQMEQALADLNSPSALGSPERARAVRDAVAAARLLLDAPEPAAQIDVSLNGSSDSLSDSSIAAQAHAVLAIERRLARSVPSVALKAHVLAHGYHGKGVTPLDGYTFLTASLRRTDRGVYVVDGNLDRDTFKELVNEAKAASLSTDKFYIFAKMATYTGHGIEIMRLDTLPAFERVPLAGDIGFYRPDPSGKMSPNVVLAANAAVVRMYVEHSDMEFEIRREDWMSTEQMEESTVDLLSDPRYVAGGEMADMRDRILGERIAAMAKAISVAQEVPRILREYLDASVTPQTPMSVKKTELAEPRSPTASVLGVERDVNEALRARGWLETRMGNAGKGDLYAAKTGNLQGDFMGLFHRKVHQGAVMLAPVTDDPQAIAERFAAFEATQRQQLPPFARAFGDASRYAMPVESRLIMFLPQTSFRPEAMRVSERKAENGTWYEVETYNPRREEWIDQKSHTAVALAVGDALGWYPDPACPGSTTPAQVASHPVTQAATREPDSGASFDV